MELTNAPPPGYAPGDLVIYLGDPTNVWTVIGLTRGVRHWWTRAMQDGTNQEFPAGVFTRIERPDRRRAAPAPAPTTPKKKKTSDHITWLLAEAPDLQQVWTVPKLAGLDTEALKQKLSHLSPGLQRMGIGNALRRAAQEGIFDPSSIVWTQKGYRRETR